MAEAGEEMADSVEAEGGKHTHFSLCTVREIWEWEIKTKEKIAFGG